MKNVTKILTLISLIGLVVFFSCKKEPQVIEPKIDPPVNNDYFGESIVRSSIGGVILDANGNGVANANVSLGSNNITTDDNGVFLFKDILVNEKRTFVGVSKNGFFKGSRALYPSANSTSYVTIQLLSAATIGSFSASTGGTINSSGVRLTFPANSVKVDGGGSYSGTVNVAAKFLDPTSEEMINQMPGDLMAVNSSNQLRFLETYGMAAVELTSPSGQKLNVADGKKVELAIPLSGPYLSDAPTTIPLWYFDEDQGIWKEEGSATKVGNEYVGEVSHFSYWNADFPGPRTTITGTINCGSTPLANGHVYMRNSTGRIMGHGTLNSLGVFSGFIPTNVALTISVTSGSFGPCAWTPIYTSSLGSFTSPVTLPAINACASTTVQNGNLTVKLVDCSSLPISNGVLEVNIGGRKSYYFPNSTGDINTNIVYCTSSSIDVTGFDYANSKQSSVQTIVTGATMNYGNLTVCGAIDEYVIYNLDGTNYRIDKIPTNQFYHYSYTGATHFTARENSSTNDLTAVILGNSVGTFTMEPDSNYLVNGLNVLSASTSMNATFTTYGTTSGSYKIGTFTGTFTDIASIPHTLSGSFRLKNP